MHTLIIKKTSNTRQKVLLGLLIAIIIFGIAKFSMGQSPASPPQQFPIQIESTNDFRTAGLIGSQSEILQTNADESFHQIADQHICIGT